MKVTVAFVFLLPLAGGTAIFELSEPVPSLVELMDPPLRPASVAPNGVGNAPQPSNQASESQTPPQTEPNGPLAPPSRARELAAPTRPSGPLLRPTPSAVPVSVSIPEISVEGSVISVGLGPDSVLDVPDPDTGGWYKHSAAPGARGATVIAAHADLNGQTALFFDLRLLGSGEEIVVNLSDGSEAKYQVQQVVLYDKVDLPQTTLFRQQGDHALHLITCGGTFDRDARSYRGNTVVIATPVTA